MVSIPIGLVLILLYFLFLFTGASLTNNEYNPWYKKTLGVVLAFTGLFFGFGGAYCLGADTMHTHFPGMAEFYYNIFIYV